MSSSIFCSFFDNVDRDNCKLNLFLERKLGVTERPRSFDRRQSFSNGHLPYHCSFYYLVRALMTLPDFISRGTRYGSVIYGISNYPHSQKEHTEFHKIPKFGVNQVSFD